jgi:predicted CXXCH cytochrome family protein
VHRLFLLSVFTARVFADPGSAVCAPCHAEIVERFSHSRMARTAAVEGPGQWSLGSGTIGKSYIAFIGQFLVQSPRSYFAATKSYGLSPGFPNTQTFRPVEEPCLQCHATGVKLIKGTQNRYPNPPFAEPGISCERCHGPASHHSVNPAKLTPERRDNVCEQCHLTGAAKVTRAGKSPYDYKPGDRLGDFVSIFVNGAKNNATDHAEQLAESACKQGAGDKLWCVTCHDPHGGLKANTCQGCHTPDKCNRGPNCASCHMPKTDSKDAHVAFTNHRIGRKPPPARPMRLFWDAPIPPRDLALAQPSIPRLERVEPKDAAVLTQLGQLYDQAGRAADAVRVYREALRLNPEEATAAANLAIYEAQRGDTASAEARWKSVFARYPGLPGPGLNLATAQLGRGDKTAAIQTLRRLLQFHPGHTQAKEILNRLTR